MELDYQAIGIRIRRLRKEQGLTQQRLAELSSQEPSNISHIERGATKLSLPTIVNIANSLNVTVDDLLCDSLEFSKLLLSEKYPKYCLTVHIKNYASFQGLCVY